MSGSIRFQLSIGFLLVMVAAPVLFPRAGDAGGEITVTAVGDIMMGSTAPSWWLPPDDGEGLFQHVGPHLKGADIVFGNLEGTLMDEDAPGRCNGSKSPWCFEFKTPVRYVRYLRENGFNAVNIANNHTWDFGWEGIKSTLETLRGSGIQPVGGRAVAALEIRGKRVALVGFSYFPNVYAYSIREIGKAADLVKKLKGEYDLVFVSLHGGAEGREALQVPDADEMYLGENRGNVLRFARGVIEAGADLVLGHGPHVLRRLEIHRGKLIVYSLGNFLTYGYFNLKGPNGISVILTVRLDADTGRFLSGRAVPVRQRKEEAPEIDPNAEGVKLLERLSRRAGSGLLFCDNGDLLADDGIRTCPGLREKTLGRR